MQKKNRFFDNTSPGFTSTYTQAGPGGRMMTPSTNLNEYQHVGSTGRIHLARLHKDDTTIEKNPDSDEGGHGHGMSSEANPLRPQTYPAQNAHM